MQSNASHSAHSKAVASALVTRMQASQCVGVGGVEPPSSPVKGGAFRSAKHLSWALQACGVQCRAVRVLGRCECVGSRQHSPWQMLALRHRTGSEHSRAAGKARGRCPLCTYHHTNLHLRHTQGSKLPQQLDVGGHEAGQQGGAVKGATGQAKHRVRACECGGGRGWVGEMSRRVWWARMVI